MKIYKLNEMTQGWFVGGFVPSVFYTSGVEVGVQHFWAGERHEPHFHKVADEITVIISGKVMINKKIYQDGDIIHVLPGEICDFHALIDTTTVVVKLPGVLNDKYKVEAC